MVYQGKKQAEAHIEQVIKTLTHRENERRKSYKQESAQKKFEEFIQHAYWFRHDIPTTHPDFSQFLRQREVRQHADSYSGSFYSQKLNRVIAYESHLEYRFLQRLEQVDKVVFYQEQPFIVPYKVGEETYSYYPDILFFLDDNRGIVVEIKPTFKMALHHNLHKWAGLRSFCTHRGFGLLITDGRYTLQQVQRHPINPEYAQDVLKTLAHGPINWTQYKPIQERHQIHHWEFLALVLKHKLVWHLRPFSLSMSL